MRVSRFPVLLAGTLNLAACHAEVLVQPEEPPAECREPSAASAPAPATASPLFVLVEPEALTAEQEHYLGVIRSQPTTARVHLARLVDDPFSLLQAGGEITFPVSPTRSLTAATRSVTRRAPDDISWSGRLVGELGDVGLVLTGRGLTGSLQTIPAGGPGTVYGFHPIGGGLQAIVCVDHTKFPPD